MSSPHLEAGLQGLQGAADGAAPVIGVEWDVGQLQAVCCVLGHRLDERVPQVLNAAHVPQPAGLERKQPQEGRQGVHFEARAGAPQLYGPAGGQVLEERVYVFRALLGVHGPGGTVTAHQAGHVLCHDPQQPQACGRSGLVDSRREDRLGTCHRGMGGGGQARRGIEWRAGRGWKG